MQGCVESAPFIAVTAPVLRTVAWTLESLSARAQSSARSAARTSDSRAGTWRDWRHEPQRSTSSIGRRDQAAGDDLVSGDITFINWRAGLADVRADVAFARPEVPQESHRSARMRQGCAQYFFHEKSRIRLFQVSE